MRYRLRTLLILLAVMPPAIWSVWLLWPPPEPAIPPQVVIVDGTLKKNPALKRDPARLNCSTTMGGPDRIDAETWAAIFPTHP